MVPGTLEEEEATPTPRGDIDNPVLPDTAVLPVLVQDRVDEKHAANEASVLAQARVRAHALLSLANRSDGPGMKDMKQQRDRRR